MICRTWRGWTRSRDADAYELRLRSVTFPAYRARKVAGLRDIRLLRRDQGDEVEFLTLLEFDDMEAVRAFGGEHWDVPLVPEEARAMLLRFDARSAHYEERDASQP